MELCVSQIIIAHFSTEALSFKRPQISKEEAVLLADKLFGLHSCTVKEFDSYDDRNFYLQGVFKQKGDVSKEEFMLKVLNHVDTAHGDLVEAQNGALLFVSNHGLCCPVPIKSLSGHYTIYGCWDTNAMYTEVRKCDKEAKCNAIRLFRYIPGRLIKSVNVTSSLLFDLGKYMGRLDKILQGFTHTSLESRILHWDLRHLPQLEPYIKAKFLGSEAREELLKGIYDKFTSLVLPNLQNEEKQVIHNDFNEANILVKQKSSQSENLMGSEWEISTVLDYGDICYSHRVFEVAICMAHLINLRFILGERNPIESAGNVLTGYQSVFPLSEKELDLIYWSVAGRFLQLLVIGSYQISLEPENEYLDSDKRIWDFLPEYLSYSDKSLVTIWLDGKT